MRRPIILVHYKMRNIEKSCLIVEKIILTIILVNTENRIIEMIIFLFWKCDAFIHIYSSSPPPKKNWELEVLLKKYTTCSNEKFKKFRSAIMCKYVSNCYAISIKHLINKINKQFCSALSHLATPTGCVLSLPRHSTDSWRRETEEFPW